MLKLNQYSVEGFLTSYFFLTVRLGWLNTSAISLKCRSRMLFISSRWSICVINFECDISRALLHKLCNLIINHTIIPICWPNCKYGFHRNCKYDHSQIKLLNTKYPVVPYIFFVFLMVVFNLFSHFG